jgi:hypothetical protein
MHSSVSWKSLCRSECNKTSHHARPERRLARAPASSFTRTTLDVRREPHSPSTSGCRLPASDHVVHSPLCTFTALRHACSSQKQVCRASSPDDRMPAAPAVPPATPEALLQLGVVPPERPVPQRRPAPGPVESGDYQPGDLLGGKYRVVETMGRGGSGVTYKVVAMPDNSDCLLRYLLGDFLGPSQGAEGRGRRCTWRSISHFLGFRV